jgi:Polyketide cyclase / dehydrase and lipid transport
MATIYKEFEASVPADFAWAAVKDIGSIHERLVKGFVTSTVLEGSSRTVTFANGMVVQEHVLSALDRVRRLAYTAIGGRAKHHNASLQVFAASATTCRLVWITDVSPDELEMPIGQMVEASASAMKATLETAYQAAAK